MRKQENESSDSQLQTCHRPASGDTVLLTSDEDKSMSTNEEESKNTNEEESMSTNEEESKNTNEVESKSTNEEESKSVNEEDRAEGQMYIEEKIHPVNTEIYYGPKQNEAV
ncbi:Hypothetical predicted protein [Paramuricea clavata]|uniref:Uncharacterized protein n=1 Tax=Paramuricea clavata TaxID=317549 RepID=A0A6S7H0I2_PARCT|nr:Hypothetical predicted protein [Paramuricea clavata]